MNYGVSVTPMNSSSISGVVVVGGGSSVVANDNIIGRFPVDLLLPMVISGDRSGDGKIFTANAICSSNLCFLCLWCVWNHTFFLLAYFGSFI